MPSSGRRHVRIECSDHSDVAFGKIDRATTDALAEICQKAVGYARSTVPVRTGALRDSIGYELETDGNPKIGNVYATMPYAAVVELGSPTMRARPYLKPAGTEHMGEYADILVRHVRDALDGTIL